MASLREGSVSSPASSSSLLVIGAAAFVPESSMSMLLLVVHFVADPSTDALREAELCALLEAVMEEERDRQVVSGGGAGNHSAAAAARLPAGNDYSSALLAYVRKARSVMVPPGVDLLRKKRSTTATAPAPRSTTATAPATPPQSPPMGSESHAHGNNISEQHGRAAGGAQRSDSSTFFPGDLGTVSANINAFLHPPAQDVHTTTTCGWQHLLHPGVDAPALSQPPSPFLVLPVDARTRDVEVVLTAASRSVLIRGVYVLLAAAWRSTSSPAVRGAGDSLAHRGDVPSVKQTAPGFSDSGRDEGDLFFRLGAAVRATVARDASHDSSCSSSSWSARHSFLDPTLHRAGAAVSSKAASSRSTGAALPTMLRLVGIRAPPPEPYATGTIFGAEWLSGPIRGGSSNAEGDDDDNDDDVRIEMHPTERKLTLIEKHSALGSFHGGFFNTDGESVVNLQNPSPSSLGCSDKTTVVPLERHRHLFVVYPRRMPCESVAAKDSTPSPPLFALLARKLVAEPGTNIGRSLLLPKYSLKHRRFIGTTTMPPELSFLMCNVAKVRPSSGLVFDPFCGTGSILMAASALGCVGGMGSELDPAVIYGAVVKGAQAVQAMEIRVAEYIAKKTILGLVSSADAPCEHDGRPTILNNFVDHKLNWPDVMRMNFSLAPRLFRSSRRDQPRASRRQQGPKDEEDCPPPVDDGCRGDEQAVPSELLGDKRSRTHDGGSAGGILLNRHDGWEDDGLFDAIVTDPPYGLREPRRHLELPPDASMAGYPPPVVAAADAGSISSTTATTTPDDPTAAPHLQHAKPRKCSTASISTSLILFSATHLTLGGRLVFWHATTPGYRPSELLQLPQCMSLIVDAPQTLSLKVHRRLIVFEKIAPFSVSPAELRAALDAVVEGSDVRELLDEAQGQTDDYRKYKGDRAAKFDASKAYRDAHGIPGRPETTKAERRRANVENRAKKVGMLAPAE